MHVVHYIFPLPDVSASILLDCMFTVCVCVCVFFPFILDIKFVGRTSRGHTGGRSHRISYPPSFCGACLNFSLLSRYSAGFRTLHGHGCTCDGAKQIKIKCPCRCNHGKKVQHAHFMPIVGVGKREAYINWYMVTCKKATLVRNYLEVYWPCAGGLSTVNAIGTQLRDPINSGLTQLRLVVLNIITDAAAEIGRNPVCNSTRFSLSMEMSRLTRDRTAELVSRDQILRRERGQGNIHFPCSADHVQDWQPYPVDLYSCYV